MRARNNPELDPSLKDEELSESLILAQDKRWRRALCMQVVRDQGFGLKSSGARVSNTYVTCPDVGDNQPKGWLIPHVDTP